MFNYECNKMALYYKCNKMALYEYSTSKDLMMITYQIHLGPYHQKCHCRPLVRQTCQQGKF